MQRVGKLFLFILPLIIISTNFCLGTIKKLWLDEICSILYSDVSSIYKIIIDLFNGADVNPPFYYLLFHVLLNLFSEDIIILRLFTAIVSILSFPIILKLAKDQIGIQKSYIIIILLVVTSFFSQYLMIELRSYGLYFSLFILFLFLLLALIKENKKPKPSHIILITVVSLLLLYTQYFAIPYVITLLVVLAVIKRKHIYYIPITLTLILFLPWLVAIKNQLIAFNHTMWQPIPSFLQLLNLPFFYFGKGIIIIVVICIVTLIKEKRIKEFINRFTFSNDELIIFSTLFIIPIVVFLLAKINLVPFVERYFIPSFIGILIFLAILIDESIKNWKYELTIISLLLVLGIFRTLQFSDRVSSQNDELEYYLLNENYNSLNIVCESPHLFFPLQYYYSENKFFLVVDLNSAEIKGNISNSLFDYYWAKVLRSKLKIDNIKEWAEFIEDNNIFIIINEPGRQLFEYYIEGNNEFKVEPIKKNIYLVEKYLINE